MSNLRQAIWVELLKLRRSRIPLISALGFALAPLASGFFTLVTKDPTLARRMGMISAKAQIVVGTADWSTYFSMLAQAVAIGGFILFSQIASWVFGREWSDHTLKDLLALPTPRRSVVFAKFAVTGFWALLLVLLVYLLGLAVGLLVGLPPTSMQTIMQGSRTLAEAAVLTVLLMPPIAFFAGFGRGYLAPMGAALSLLILAQLVAAAGWGEYFPWSIPALHAGTAGPEMGQMGPISYALVFVTALLGIGATVWWWEGADQAH